MKVCNVFELKKPTNPQIAKILNNTMPMLNDYPALKTNILEYIQGDLRKMDFMQKLYKKKPELINNNIMDHIFEMKSYNEDSKKITQCLINSPVSIDKHNLFMNETDRTIVALLYHENIVDPIAKFPVKRTFPFYLKILDNMCYADYIDRITFQNQIWLFNEMSSLMKTFYNNKIYHDTFPENKNIYNPSEVRFTKVLTKYSTEYNNIIFTQALCQNLSMCKSDMCLFFLDIKSKYSDVEILELFENDDISKLDINRIYKYLDKYTKENVLSEDCSEVDETELTELMI